MLDCDVNVLVSAHNTADPRHERFRDWLQSRALLAAGTGPRDLDRLTLARYTWSPGTPPSSSLTDP